MSQSRMIKDLMLQSEYPNKPLLIRFSTPFFSGDLILQYRITVLVDLNMTCVHVSILKCADCNDDTLGRNGNKLNCTENERGVETNRTYYKHDKILSIRLNKQVISPFVIYRVSVQAVNGWGWGKISTKTIKSGQYTSNAVYIMSTVSVYPNYRISVCWYPPKTPNGYIVQYVVWIFNVYNKCLISWIFTCSSCNVKDISNSNSLPLACQKANPTQMFLKGLHYNCLNSSDDLIEAGSIYSIHIVPVNGYGWGDMSISDIYTQSYYSGPVFNLEIEAEKKVTMWMPPLKPNGIVTDYFMWIMRSDDIYQIPESADICIHVTRNQLTELKQLPVICKRTQNLTIKSPEIQFKVKSSVTNLVENRFFVVCVVAINELGCGQESCVNFPGERNQNVGMSQYWFVLIAVACLFMVISTTVSIIFVVRNRHSEQIIPVIENRTNSEFKERMSYLASSNNPRHSIIKRASMSQHMITSNQYARKSQTHLQHMKKKNSHL